jgi:AcrR family transcriptional regulator
MVVTKRPRMTREAWIRAAYGALESGGIEAVQIEPLCRALRVSKGSFYWHFRDRAALLMTLLDHWSSQSSGFRLESERSSRAAERLERLAETYAAAAGQRADLAIMRWAARDPRIRARVSRVLERRLHHVAGLLEAHGHPAGEAAWRAQVIAYAYMGWLDRAGPTGVTKRAALEWMRRLIALALAPAGARPHRAAAAARRRSR